MERRELRELLAPLVVEKLEQRLCSEDLEVLRLFAEQAVAMGIDYRALGVGWHHPSTRLQYRGGRHRSQKASHRRQQAAKARLEALAQAEDLRSGLVEAFLEEVSARERHASYEAVKQALKAELLLPRRGAMPSFRCIFEVSAGFPRDFTLKWESEAFQ